MSVSDLNKYIVPGKRIHLIGIGGVSMSPLAEVLAGMGVRISGSDIKESDTVKHLRSLGIDIHIGHSAENIEGAACIIRTAAARDDNPEVAAARKAGIPVFERAQAWGYIMQGYRNAICISGTHGKTTTTSMATHILMAAQSDPTVMIGGTLPLLKAGHHIGKGDTIILESCEYYDSFHSFFPTIAVVLNVDSDHLDYFKTLDAIKASFRQFASLVPENGHIVCCYDDSNAMDALSKLNRPLVTFGTGDGANIQARNIVMEGSGSRFDVYRDGEYFTTIKLCVPGIHNVRNALAASTAALLLGVPPKAIQEGLATFTGAGRRFEFKGMYNGARVYDDYAHHPGELHALLDMVLSLGYKRTILAFQPHTYSRTNALFDEFVKELSR
ncbi:MAG: UDP-N-acetylmuramate--L-alanine ligase, partial [Oscillospiraceae bacterium]|nr:UDP-N-acetylmuramate--L-alanine ligase [Oscillospiraceae bacterium]